MIEKPTIIFTSLGRTGSRFFATLFRDIVPNSISLHEPDTLVLKREYDVFKRIQEAGLINMFIRKPLGQWRILKISDERITNKINHAKAIQEVFKQRKYFVEGKKEQVYIESSYGYYGVIDVVDHVFKNHRLIYLIRDGRDWVRSHINWGIIYGKGKIKRMIGHTWPTALDFFDDSYYNKWYAMSRFEKICWAWVKFNEYALQILPNNPHARLFYFEDIFQSENRYQHLEDLVTYATTLPDMKIPITRSLDGWLDKKIHKSTSLQFPAWENWSVEQKMQFDNICGDLMRRLNYY